MLLIYAHLLSQSGNDVVVVVESKRWLRRIAANVLQRKPSWFSDCSARILRMRRFEESRLAPCDVVVASHWQGAMLLRDYSEKMGIKFHFIQHDERLYHGAPEEIGLLPLKKIVVSSWLQEIMKKDYHANSDLVLNTVDRNLFHPVSSKKNNSVIRILLLHHNYEWKGTKEGVEIVQNLKERHKNVQLVLFGSRRENIDVPCDEYHYSVSQDKLAEIYSGCDIFLCPSWDEGFGLPSLEAMACRCAVVTYDNGGSRDFAFHEKTALVAKRKDKDDLMRQLERFVVDGNLRRTIAENGYQFVQSMPTWEEQAKKLEDIFRKAIQHA